MCLKVYANFFYELMSKAKKPEMLFREVVELEPSRCNFFHTGKLPSVNTKYIESVMKCNACVNHLCGIVKEKATRKENEKKDLCHG